MKLAEKILESIKYLSKAGGSVVLNPKIGGTVNAEWEYIFIDRGGRSVMKIKMNDKVEKLFDNMLEADESEVQVVFELNRKTRKITGNWTQNTENIVLGKMKL
jgi:hypothetical protein